MWYCLPDSLSLLVYNPETSSRVTLALLGTVFQTALTVLARLWLSRHIQNQSRIADATDLFFHGFFYSFMICLRLAGRYDCHGLSLAGGYPAPYRRKYNP